MTHFLETLLAATHEQLFRLALLATGSIDAASQQLIYAAAAVPAEESEAEASLLRGLEPKRRRYGRWEPGNAELTRAGVDARQARAILRQIGQLQPVERLVVGLFYIRGLTCKEIAAALPHAPDCEDVLMHFRAAAAVSLGLVAAEAKHGDLARIDLWLDGRLDEAEATDLRGLTFADAETRALRDGMLAVRTHMPQMLAGMFSVAAPAKLLDRLCAIGKPARQKRAPRPARPAAVVALVLGVLALAALIVVVPGLDLQPSNSTAAPNASAIIEAALHRFERTPLDRGVLHERYEVRVGDRGPVTIERWYDYAAPHRLRAEVRVAGDQQPHFAIRSDGRGTIQYQRPQSPPSSYKLTPEQAEPATPLLRSFLMPLGFNSDGRAQPEISVLYLAQAQALNATLAGRTTVDGRDAFLLRYATDTLPTEETAGQARQVLLSVDAELSALLDVKVIAEGSGETVALTPWHAEQIEVLEAVPDSYFALADANAATITTPRSLSIPYIPEQMYSTLDTAIHNTRQTLLAPTNLAEAMRGFVLYQQRGDDSLRFVLLYESEFHSLLLFPGDDIPNADARWGEESESGRYRYRTTEGFGNTPGSLFAQVRRIDDPQLQATVLLMDPLSTPAEREQRLREIVASLEPITDQNIGSFPQLAPDPSS